MTDRLKLRFRSARVWITHVLRITVYITLILGGMLALSSPPQTIVSVLGLMLVRTMGVLLIGGASAALFGWVTGRWLWEQLGVVFAAGGALVYFISVMFIPDILTIGGGLRACLTLYIFLSLSLRVFEIERYTSVSYLRGRMIPTSR